MSVWNTFNTDGTIDAASIANLFSEDAGYLNPIGAVWTDRKTIKNGIADRMKVGQPKLMEKILEAHPSGKVFGGHHAFILVPKDDDWLIRMLISNITLPK